MSLRTPFYVALLSLSLAGTAEATLPWRSELAPALTDATAHHQLVLVDFTASWCGPCARMDQLVWQRADIEALARQHFVALRVDTEEPAGAALRDRFHVSAMPTLLVLRADGTEFDRVVGENNGETVLALLRAWAQGGASFDVLRARLEQTPNDVALRFDVASRWVNRGDAAHARPLLEQVVREDPRNASGHAAQALLLLGERVALALEHNPAQAIASLQDLQRRFGQSTSAARSGFPLARALHAASRDTEALAQLEQWVRPTLDGAAARAISLAEWMRQERWQLPRAEQWLRAVLARAPRDAGVLGSLADVVEAQNRRPEALELAQRALAASPRGAAEQARVRRLQGH